MGPEFAVVVSALEQFQAKFVPPTPAPGTSGSDNNNEGALKSDELNLKNAQVFLFNLLTY